MAVRDVVQAAAGVGGGDNLYVEDVFSTYLYTGNDSSQTITNGIDLAGEGGLVWTKDRGPVSASHYLTDTAIGIDQYLKSDVTNAQQFSNTRITSLNLDGYTLGSNAATNASGASYASWTFRKAPNFFDVVTWTGDGQDNRQIAHNLGSVPGCIMVKKTNTTGQWFVYHRGLNNGVNAAQYYLNLETTNGQGQYEIWENTTPTSTVFTIDSFSGVNGTSDTYVAYVFAHDAGGFGDDGEQNVISCGSFSAPSGDATVTLGYEPQYILWKRTDAVQNWNVYDTMRGWAQAQQAQLYPNLTQAEDMYTGSPYFYPTATGFQLNSSFGLVGDYIYIAIRRGPMKTPEAGTEVFAIDTQGSSAGKPNFKSGFPVDFAFIAETGASAKGNSSRLTSPNVMYFNNTNAEASDTERKFDYQNGWGDSVSVDSTRYSWMFKRAPGFMDVVAYSGNSVARAVPHNLGVAPEMMIVKPRDSTGGEWKVYSNALSIQSYLRLNLDEAFVNFGAPGPWNNTAPTDSAFNVSVSGWSINDTGRTYIAYLFASCPGVSKVGSYTGTGADLNVDCGFSAGARFILIKRTDGTGDWYVWDSARGIVSGNDPYLLLNSGAAQVTNTDYIDPLASGFTVTASAPAALNASGGSYIFLAIA
jgi:hypothetical protein